MAALGESDPTYSMLQEALKKAKALTHVRPVDERIASSRTFIDRAKKRIGSCREEVLRAQEVLAQAQAKLQSEEQSLVEGEARLAALSAESEGLREEIPSTLPTTTFVQELAELRALRFTATTFRSSLRPEGEAAKKEIANRPGICHIRPSIWLR